MVYYTHGVLNQLTHVHLTLLICRLWRFLRSCMTATCASMMTYKAQLLWWWQASCVRSRCRWGVRRLLAPANNTKVHAVFRGSMM